MPEIICEYEIGRNERLVKCGRLCAEAGFTISVHHGICAKCQGAVASPEFKNLLIRSIKSRLAAGEAPRYQTSNPVNACDAIKKLRALGLDDKELREVMRETFYSWTGLKPDHGGDERGVVVARFAEVLEASELPQKDKDGLISELIGT